MGKPSIVYHEDPLIAQYDQLFSQQECQHLRDLAIEKLRPATVVSTAGPAISDTRKSDVSWLPHDFSEHVKGVCEHIASIVGHPLNHAEQLQIVRYQVGGKFDEHTDSFDLYTQIGKFFYSRGGQRLKTAILYLNTTSAGGETFFPVQGLEISPTLGNLLVFENCKKQTLQPHPLSVHGSRPLMEGEKWIATLWFRDKRQY